MNDDKKHSEEENLSRRLKDLPCVKASPDFEARLQRRIASSKEKRERKSLFDVLFFPRRVPVFATSILALLAVSVISYYVFVKSRDESSLKIPQPPTIAERFEPQQSNQVGSETMDDKSNQQEAFQEIPVQNDETLNLKKETVTPSLKLQEKRNDVASEEIARPTEPNIESDEQAAVSTQDNLEKGIVVQEEPVANVVQQKVEMQAAEPTQAMQQKMVQPLQQLQKMRSTTEKFPVAEFNATPPKMKAGMIPDSVKIADSLRQDSIKKALQKRLLQPKQKIRQ